MTEEKIILGKNTRFPLKGLLTLPEGSGQIVKQVQHFLPKFQLVFSSQDTSWDDC